MTTYQCLGLLAVLVSAALYVAYVVAKHAQPAPLSQDEQQRQGDTEWQAWQQAMSGQSMILGEMRAAAQRIQNKYPEWRASPRGEKMISPDKSEFPL